MMRKIKFRAWIESQNRMERTIEISPFHVGDCDRFRWNHGEVELMQYTGLKDKNGVAIYEGDIVRHEDLSIGCTVDLFVTGEVKMLEGGWLVDDGSKAEWLWSETAENEVIGNIYEHPHLLEVAQ